MRSLLDGLSLVFEVWPSLLALVDEAELILGQQIVKNCFKSRSQRTSDDMKNLPVRFQSIVHFVKSKLECVDLELDNLMKWEDSSRSVLCYLLKLLRKSAPIIGPKKWGPTFFISKKIATCLKVIQSPNRGFYEMERDVVPRGASVVVVEDLRDIQIYTSS